MTRTFSRSLAVFALSLGLLSWDVDAAQFGVPTAPGSDPLTGWFILVGHDAAGLDGSPYLGDITNELRLYIEVTNRNDLQIDIYDPGFYDPTRPGDTQLDWSGSGGPTGLMTYELYAPGTPAPIWTDVMAGASFGPDTAATDNALWRFFNNDVGTAPGVYELVIRFPDGPGVDTDVNIFGVSVSPDYNTYSYYATVGHSNWSQARLGARSVTMHPYSNRASAGVDATGIDLCGYDLISYDLEAPVSGAMPPRTTITTRLGYSNQFGASIDSGWQQDRWPNLAGLNAGDDHGIMTYTVDSLEAINETTFLMPPMDDFNAFSFQIYNYETDPPFFYPDYPVTPSHPRWPTHQPLRIYLPNGSAAVPSIPIKEYVTHRIVTPPAGGTFPTGTLTTVDVDVSIVNPLGTGYDLLNITGNTQVNPSADIADPDPTSVIVSGGMGGAAMATGKSIAMLFTRIREGQTGTVRYRLDVTPSTSDFMFLTGDGSDFIGGVDPTLVTYDTEISTGEEFAPCMIQIQAVPPPCAVVADGIAPARSCLNEGITLDGSTSGAVSCPGGALEYRWTGPGLPASPPFTTDPTALAASDMSGSVDYTLESRCAGDTSCSDTFVLMVDVSDTEIPANDLGGDLSIGSCDLPVPLGSPGDTGLYSYSWSTTSGVAMVDLISDSPPTVPETTFIYATPGTYDLTLSIVALSDPLCAATDTIDITVGDGTPTGRIGNNLSAVKDVSAMDVVLEWPLGSITPDRYNVHRTDVVTEIDRSLYLAPILNLSEILTATYTDTGAVAIGSGRLLFYDAFGRDCAGLSDIP